MKARHTFTPPVDMRAFRSVAPNSRMLMRTSYALGAGVPVSVITAQFVTYDHRTQLALIVTDDDERSTIPPLYVLVEEITDELGTYAHVAASSYMRAIRQSSTDEERAEAKAQFETHIAEIMQRMKPFIADIPGESPPQTLLPASFDQFPA